MQLTEVQSFLNETQQHAQGTENAKRLVETHQNKLKKEFNNIANLVKNIEGLTDPWARRLTSSFKTLITHLNGELDTLIKQRKFNEEFEDKLMFLVTGRVNAGKSSLGNLIAGQGFESLVTNPYQQLPTATFKVHAISSQGGSESPTHFREAATECTAAIQSFSLGKNMTWIDTPGLASLTQENGKMAQKYLKSADLALFVVNSDNPMTRDDVATLINLGINEQKPFVILVTKFDLMKEVFDPVQERIDSSPVPKPAENRQQQRDYILDILEDQKLSGNASQYLKEKVLFVSTLCLKRAIAQGDKQMWQDAGGKVLFELFKNILKSDATQLKTEAPKRSFNALLNRLVSANTTEVEQVYSFQSLIEHLTCSIGQFDQCTEQLKKSWPRVKERLLLAITQEATQALQESNFNSSDPVTTLKKISEAKTQEHLKGHLSQHLSQLIENLQVPDQMGNLSITVDEVKDVYQEFQYETKNPIKSSAIGGLLGGLIGSFVPVIGTAIGASIGAGAGAAVGSSHKETERTRVGDNREQVIANAIANLRQELSGALDNFHHGSLQKMIDQPKSEIIKLLKDLDRIKNNLSSCKIST